MPQLLVGSPLLCVERVVKPGYIPGHGAKPNAGPRATRDSGGQLSGGVTAVSVSGS
jgi:hypothetical protein